MNFDPTIIVTWYKKTEAEIESEIDLAGHLKRVNAFISYIDDTIETVEVSRQPTDNLQKFKNELYYLKWQILEKS